MRRRSAWPARRHCKHLDVRYACVNVCASERVDPAARLRTADPGANPPCLRTLRRRCRCPSPRSSRVATGCRGPSACSRPRPATCTPPTGAVASPPRGGRLADARSADRCRTAGRCVPTASRSSATALSCSRTWAKRRAACSGCVRDGTRDARRGRRRRHAPAAHQLRAGRRAAAAVDHGEHAARAARARLPSRRRRRLRRARRRPRGAHRRRRARLHQRSGDRSLRAATCTSTRRSPAAPRASRSAPDGALGPRETFAEYGEGTYPDGLAFDEEGFLWVVSHRQQPRACVSRRTARSTTWIEDADAAHVAWVRGCVPRGERSGRPHLDRRRERALAQHLEHCVRRRRSPHRVPGLPARRRAVRPFARPSPGVAPAHWHWPQS